MPDNSHEFKTLPVHAAEPLGRSRVLPHPLDASVSVFEGSTNTTPEDTLPLATVLEQIREGRYRPYVEQLRRTLQTQGEDAYDVEKKHSVAFTPAGTFRLRNSASLETPSGCLNLDIDDLPDLGGPRLGNGKPSGLGTTIP